MAGLDEAGLEELLPAKPKPEAQPGAFGPAREQAVIDEIYKRHGINSSRSLDEAIDRIGMQAKLRSSVGNAGGELGAWPNHEAREAARAEYAAEGKTPDEVRMRYLESIHLLDPESYEYMRRFGRDEDFLKAIRDNRTHSEQAKSNIRGGGELDFGSTIKDHAEKAVRQQAIAYHDGSKDQRLARRGEYGDVFADTSGGYQRFGGWGNAAMNATANTDTGTGAYLAWSEIPAESFLTSWSGETRNGGKGLTPIDSFLPVQMRVAAALGSALTDGEAWDRARANHAANVNYKFGTSTPVADFPAGSKPTGKDVAARIAELQRQVQSASTPLAAERWHRTTGYAPPGWITDPAESAVRAIDPSMLIPMGTGAYALKTAGRAAIRPLAVDFAKDMAQEQAFNLGLQGAFGGIPDRSARQFWLGGGQPGKDFSYKSPEQLEQTRRDADQLHRDLSDNERLSTAREEAYHGLEASGALGPNAQSRARLRERLKSSQ